MIKTFHVNISPFDIDLLVHYGPGINKMIKQHNKIYKPKIELERDAAVGLTVISDTKKGPAYCLFLDSNNYDDSVLVHECFHIIYQTADYAGITLTDSSEEYYAYAMQKLFSKIKKKL